MYLLLIAESSHIPSHPHDEEYVPTLMGRNRYWDETRHAIARRILNNAIPRDVFKYEVKCMCNLCDP